MELTAKEILRKHVFNLMRPSFETDKRTHQIVDAWLVMTEEKEAILAAMKDAVELAFDAGQENMKGPSPGINKQQFINSLFPESK